ncbi:nucleolar DEAD-box protein required for synthesis of 60S ribosomal subunit [Scheffersomyces spartinae]|uniref:ATP-dependent RNA helicase DRS1 n=1 Tax=Scheffersomyces spartinae TaxID=45513 RepID=A0A9P8AGJ6_9ASCO|nr:nucleolar DEAD-box protein required for synthesis of 60S ribosomal subunit [Scheffersomyces spartinae]KAG7191470.1 nucleolar DEAD-box protein required for synthesis of 60S ribosomal subunit [Scheffersomyces spartinae]
MVKKKDSVAGDKSGSKATNNNDDFILTIDSDDEEVAYEESESEIEQEEEKKSSKKKGGKKDNDDAPEVDEDLNPDFHFALDDITTSGDFTGWDFKLDDASAKKDVDLDGILRRKGGLTNLVATGDDNDESASEEEPSEEDEDDDEDDDLAMDGFGMGTKEVEEKDEDDEEDDGEESLVEADMDEEHPNTDSEDEEDSEEAIKEFYADEEESQSATSQVHTTFQTLQLSRPVLKGLGQLGYTRPSPIQSAVIPIALLGKDVVAGAVTGSGKTAAYLLPIIERLLYKPAKISSTRVVILAPTRELAIQVCDVGKKIAHYVNNLSFGLAVGGLNLRQQEQQLKTRPDIVVATPGRLIDHIRNSPSFSIDSLEVLVIDEADRMLDEGFQVELTEILSLIPKHKRQTLLFSATMNTKIQDLIQLSLQRPIRIMIDPPKTAATKLIQEFVRIRKRDTLKPALLFQLLKQLDPNQERRTIVFVARKESAHRLRIILGLLGMKVAELHGSLTQEQRLSSVTDFKNLTVPVLICTDLAARGLDIPKIELVLNYDMPKSYDIYLHRVGRTARAGRDGVSITFVGESSQDRAIVKSALKALEESNGKEGKVVSRNVEWDQVEKLSKLVEAKQEVITEVLEEEQQAKEILQAEMELTKASNLLKHEKEIKARPKRTWFETEKEKKQHQTDAMQQLTKHGKKVNSKKRKAIESKKEDGSRSYKKTKQDRMDNQVKKSVPKKKQKSKGKKRA